MKLRLEIEEELSGALRTDRGAPDRAMQLVLRHRFSSRWSSQTLGIINIDGLASSCPISGALEPLNGCWSYALAFSTERDRYCLRALKRGYWSDPYAGLTMLRGALWSQGAKQESLGQVLLRFDARASLHKLWRSLNLHA